MLPAGSPSAKISVLRPKLMTMPRAPSPEVSSARVPRRGRTMSGWWLSGVGGLRQHRDPPLNRCLTPLVVPWPARENSCRLPTGNYVIATKRSEFRRFSDDVGGPFGPEQPVARGFDLVRLEIGDLAVEERLGDG